MSKLYRYIFSCSPLASQGDYGVPRRQAVIAYCEAQALAWAIKAQGGYASDFQLESVEPHEEDETSFTISGALRALTAR